MARGCGELRSSRTHSRSIYSCANRGSTTPAGKAMFQMMGVFAEFERAMIAERVRAGLARARSEGKRLGRPPIASALENKSMRLWQLLGGLAYGSLPNGSASIHRPCSASAALSTAQASRWRSR